MKQNQKGKNSFDGDALKRGDRKEHFSADSSSISSKKTSSFGAADRSNGGRRTKKTAAFSGRFDLVDSFEAEESKKRRPDGPASKDTFERRENGGESEKKSVAKKSEIHSKKKGHGKKKSAEKRTGGEKFDTTAEGSIAGGRNTAEKSEKAGRTDKTEKTDRSQKTEKPSRAAAGKSPAPAKKGKKNRGAGDPYRDDSEIKTRAGNKYIPFETYDDDDIIPTTEGYYDSGKREPRLGGRSSDTTVDAVPSGAVVGRNAVRELLRSDRSVDKIYVKSGEREGSIVVIVAEAVSRKIPIVEVSGEKLDALAGSSNHQGVVALAAQKQYTDIDSILKIAKDRGEKPLIVIADGIEDPQNLGAVIRCAECAGAHGVIIPKRRAVGVTPIVTKASAGAVEHMAIAKVTNLADAVEKLKKAGLWIFAAEAGGVPYYEADFNVPSAIILGSEGFGVSRLLKEKSDFTVSIPMYGRVNSLNVSTAAAVILCHAARMQRVGQ